MFLAQECLGSLFCKYQVTADCKTEKNGKTAGQAQAKFKTYFRFKVCKTRGGGGLTGFKYM